MDSPIIDKIRKLHALAERAGTEHEAAAAAAFMDQLCRKYRIDPAALFGDDWQQSRTRRIVTEMRIETERKVYESKTWIQEIEHIFGPCLACAVEIEYRAHGFRWGKEWVKEQFEPNTRKNLVGWLESGSLNRYPSLATLRSLLCKQCVDRFEAIRSRRLEERDLKRKQKEERQHKEWEQKMRRERWQATWRKPKRGEFEGISGRAAFFAFAGRTRYEIVFRWRVSNRSKCRGNDPGAAVGMWVDGRLVAHYYGWDLTAYDDYDYQDRFGTGFELWFERNFQVRLLRAKPDVAWSLLDRKLMGEPDAHVGWIVHVGWHDGERYAKVGPLPTITEVTEFARKRLRMTITEPAAARPAAASASH